MATLVPEMENLACMGCNDLSNFDHSQIDCALLMSLLDDSQGLEDDHHDNERLTTVIKSLEAEIDQHMINGHDSFQDSYQGSNNGEDWQLWEDGQRQTQDFPESNSLDVNWMDIEMEMAPTSTSDDMNFWYSDTSYGHDHEVQDVYEYGYDVFPLEENNYSSWGQEQNVSALSTQG